MIRHAFRALVTALCVAFTCIGITRPATSHAAAAVQTDATSLYNAGTVALTRGEVGPAVAFLLAAARLEPRAPDIRANLVRAIGVSSAALGEEQRADHSASDPFPLATDEAWWIAAALLAAGAGVGIARALSSATGASRGTGTVRWTGTARGTNAVRWTGTAFVLTGVLLGAWLHRQAWEESAHPEAVVVVPLLSVERGPDEPSRPAVLLGAGERVRMGQARGGLVEIRVGENRIGWATREGLWRVADAPRYTSGFEPR